MVTFRGIRRRVTGALRAGVQAGLSPNGIAPYIPAGGRFEGFPAGINRWVTRYTGKNRSHYPAQWRRQLAALADDVRPTPRLAVVMHVHFPDLVAEMLSQLHHLPVPFDLIVTNSSGEVLPLDLDDLPLLRHASVFELANHGRDILPLVSIVNTGILNPYEMILKVHTKRSTWRADHATLAGDGDAWRAEFIDNLLGSTENVRGILHRFATEHDLGLVTAPGNIVGAEHWGGDREITRHLLLRLELELDQYDLRFAAGSMYWIRGFLLQGLYSLKLSSEDFEEEAGQIDGTTAHGVERLLGILAAEAGYRLDDVPVPAERSGSKAWQHFEIDAPRTPRARAIPFYLPQFHSFPENDLWWGPGFTEWSNVSSSRPVYRGHSQPLLPSRLGFYDLESPAVAAKQRELARGSGISGFMYYYYWFAGTRLMDGPVERVVAGHDDAPFCLMWANENWTRRWDGSSSDILIGQDYERVPATRFVEDVAHLLKDPRYIRVDGRPLLAVYRITQIPDFENVIEAWREYARREGIGELFLLTVDVGAGMQGLDGDPLTHGLDGALEFPPHNTYWDLVDQLPLHPDGRFRGRVMHYRSTVRSAEASLRHELEPWRYPGVMVNFDNTARRQWQPDIWFGANPYTYRRWLDSVLTALSVREPEHRIVFINAWNEWAEGAVLEPSVRHGDGYLLATRDALLR